MIFVTLALLCLAGSIVDITVTSLKNTAKKMYESELRARRARDKAQHNDAQNNATGEQGWQMWLQV